MYRALLLTSCLLASATLTGCENSTISKSDVGTVAGGIAGGVIGNQLSGGNTAATIGGAVGGAYLGNRVGKAYDNN